MKRIPLRSRTNPAAVRMAAIPESEDAPRLTNREARFVAEYLVDFNATRAARMAGYSNNQAATYGWKLIRQPAILAEINRHQVLNREKLQLQREDLMQFWYDLAYADVRELLPIRVKCCRHCWGVDHGYQFTRGEMQALYRKHRERYRNSPHDPPPMDERGGDGFDQRRLPFSVENGQDHDCPECFGLGVSCSEPLDLTKLSRGAQLLIGGIKVDKFGNAEIKFNDRLRAAERLAEYCGFIKPKKGEWVFDFDGVTDSQLDALLQEARTRGLLRDDEFPQMVDVTPPANRLSAPSEDDERVS